MSILEDYLFTGIIEDVGRIEQIMPRGRGALLAVRTALAPEGLHGGDSISVDGACLTVTQIKGNSFFAEVSAETMNRTTLGSARTGTIVNLERALRLGDRLGGHLVTGHVDAKGLITAVFPSDESLIYEFQVEERLSGYIIEKGSIAVDGISLTVNRCIPGRFQVNIVPYTLKATAICEKKEGDQVNIECDLIGKYVEQLLHRERKDKPAAIDREFLAAHGFL